MGAHGQIAWLMTSHHGSDRRAVTTAKSTQECLTQVTRREILVFGWAGGDFAFSRFRREPLLAFCL